MLLPRSSTAPGAARPPTRRAWPACASDRLDLADLAARDAEVDPPVHQVRPVPSETTALHRRRGPGTRTPPRCRTARGPPRTASTSPGGRRPVSSVNTRISGLIRHAMSISTMPSTPPAALMAIPRVEPIERPLEQLLRRGVLEAVAPRRGSPRPLRRRTAGPARGSAPARSRRLSHSGHGQLESPFADQAAPTARCRRAAGPVPRRTDSRTIPPGACRSRRHLRPAGETGEVGVVETGARTPRTTPRPRRRPRYRVTSVST